MKKYLYTIVFATVILLNTTVVQASNEVYYRNRNNIDMTEREYNNLLSLGFTEKYIDRMDQDEFLANKDIEATLLSQTTKYIKTSTMMRNGIMITTSEEITKEEALREKELQSQKTHNRDPFGNYYDGIVSTTVFEMVTGISGIDDDYMRFMNNIEWLVIPSDRYYDIIGIGMESAKVQFGSGIYFKKEWVTEGGIHNNDTVCAPKYVSTGGLSVYKLPNGNLQSLEAVIYFNVMKQTGVGTVTSLYAVGDYAHAINNVTPENLMSHISISDSFGIMFDATYVTSYQGISEAVASFTGTW